MVRKRVFAATNLATSHNFESLNCTDVFHSEKFGHRATNFRPIEIFTWIDIVKLQLGKPKIDIGTQYQTPGYLSSYGQSILDLHVSHVAFH